MLSLPWLDHSSLEFPATSLAFEEPNGLLAAGGDLSAQRLINAYRQGIFPWYNESEHEEILWWSPSPRAVIFPDKLHISSSLKKFLRKQPYTHTFNTCFVDVVRACQAPRATQDGTWIGPSMLNAYVHLHQLGYAHSIEIWNPQKQLVGGLYGIALGKVFFGESMFSKAKSASQYAMKKLCETLIIEGFTLLDCQVESAHIMKMGAELIDRRQFEKLLGTSIDQAHPEKAFFS